MKVSMLVLNKFTHDTRVYKEGLTLIKAGYSVTVWAIGDNLLPSREKFKGITVKRLRLFSTKIRFCPLGLRYIEIVIRMAYNLIQERAQIYHAHDANALLSCYLASRFCKANLIYDAHELWGYIPDRDLRTKLRLYMWKFIEALLCPRANNVITVNIACAKELNKLYGINPIILMNCQKYIEIKKTNYLHRELNIPDDHRIAIYVGNWATGRGLEQVIDSVSYLDRVIVIFLGEDNLNGKLQLMAKELGVDNLIRFCLPVSKDEVLSYVANADIGLVPTQKNNISYYLSSGNKLFHYIMAGIPVVVSNHPEKNRIVDKYKVGVVFDETDPKSIAHSINTILNDKQKYQKMCYHAKRAAREDLNWEIEEKKLIKLYRSLIKKS